MTIQHQRVLTQNGQTIQTIQTPTTVHTMQPQMQQVRDLDTSRLHLFRKWLSIKTLTTHKDL